MLNFIKFLQKRPSDKTIKIGRIVFGLLYIGIMFYTLTYTDGNIDNKLFFGKVILDNNSLSIVEYILTAIGIMPVIMGVSNICLLKKNQFRILQIFFGIILFYISSIMPESANFNSSNIVFLMAFLPITGGITGKCITTKCMKYKEVITKIRV